MTWQNIISFNKSLNITFCVLSTMSTGTSDTKGMPFILYVNTFLLVTFQPRLASGRMHNLAGPYSVLITETWKIFPGRHVWRLASWRQHFIVNQWTTISHLISVTCPISRHRQQLYHGQQNMNTMSLRNVSKVRDWELNPVMVRVFYFRERGEFCHKK